MAKFRLRSKITGQYVEITQEAIETPVEDLMGYFEGKDVETVLSEIGMKIRNGVATPHDIDLVRKMLDAINDDILALKDGVNGIVGIDTETLKEMVGKYEDGSLGSGGSGGEGGGSLEGIDIDVLKEMIDKYLHGTLVPPLVPTIETTFPERVVIEQGDNVTFDIYFQTPNLGDGTLYIVVNNAEIDFQPTLIGGDNQITIKGSYLTKANNTVSVYAKDRVGMTSNRITFTVIAGGVNLTTTFDYTVDYVVGQNILFPFNVTSEMEGDIILYRTIDGIEIEPFPCERGYNSFYLNDYITGVGSHTVSMYAVNGTYKSKVLTFNVVIASSTELSLSSSTTSGSQFTYGEAIEISYRVSKLGNETFELNFYVDGELMRTANVGTGSYIWTIAAGVLDVGVKTIKITATGTSGDSAEIYLDIEVVKGAFNPIEIVKGGMTILLDSDGYSNELADRTIWKDKSGNENNAELVGFNFSTNGWNPTLAELEPSPDGTTAIEKVVEYKGLVCNNDAYVRIPYKPFYNNVINGFTMELLYTPEHSGNNEARILEYVDHEAPYVGVYASIDEAFIKSESQQTAGQIDLDYESGEIQLDFVIDREKKLCLIYVDGICTRYWSLSDSGNNRESFAIDQDYIYLNFSALDPKYCGGTNIIRKFICYERALSHSEIENNWIANAADLVEMERRYNWCYNTQIPKLQIYGDISNISANVPAYVRIKYSSPDEEKYGASFDLESSNSPIYLQGTSSLGYSRKNYRFILIDNNGQQYFHEMFPGNALPESTYTAKCDYVDSSMACNVSLCKIANDTLYGPNFTDAQRDNPRRRTATYGHAIELVNVVDNREVSLGAYTLIIDRYAEESMGYKQSEYPNILVLEGESNSDIGASAFYAWSESHPLRPQFPLEVSYYNEGFRVVYPPTNEAAYDFADIRELVKFIDESSDDDFKDTFESYFSKESVIKYYLFCLCFASVDTLSKNLHLVRYNSLWYILPYDCDSVLGGSNKGFLNISSSCEVGDVYDELDPTIIVEPNQFNSWNGRLWARMRDTFGADLKSMWTTLRSNGIFNYDSFIKYFDEIWDAIPPSMYNSSQQIKYIDYGEEGQVAMHGNRKHQIKKFLRERMAYLDSKFEFYSDGGAENYANIRMNVIGNVSLTIETYYPVYYTVKWATNNIETHRIGKNTKKTFSYFSDVSTDREVLLYLPHTLKTIENLDSLKPASIDISKAIRLTNIEVHSDKLFSVSLATNKYLRNINFNGCSKLGTDTTSTMSIMYAKYLKTLDVRGTKLTAVDFPNAGGSIVNCYLPETITSLTVKNQLLLRNLILQDDTVDLATVEISNCPLIERLSEGPTNAQFDVFKYCRSLLINNSFANTEEILLSGFTRLQNITLSNIEALKGLGLNDLCEAGQTSGLRYVGVSNCKNLTTLTMNCSSDDYEISFAKKGLLDLSTSNITELKSNCVIKGLDTIVVPRTIRDMFFTSEYGSGYSEIYNIWSALVASIDSSGVFPEARHLDADTGRVDDYVGIDFIGLQLRNIDLSALVNVAEAKNFYLSPTSVNPSFNKNRDGVEYPYLQPSGILDLSDYTESLAKFFDGVDLNKLIVVCNKSLPQTDLSYCFYNATFSNDDAIDTILSNMSSVTNLDYCFYKTGVSSTDILNKINTGPNTTMNYTFAECPNVRNLSNVVIPDNVIEVEGMFNKCPLTSITNMSINVRGSISGLFKGCEQLMTIATLNIPNVTDVSSTFEGCSSLTNLTGFELPSTCTAVDNLFNGCYALKTLSMVFGPSIQSGENWYPPNIETLNDTSISTNHVKLANCNTLTTINNLSVNTASLDNFFDGCTNLRVLNGFTVGNKATSAVGLFKGLTLSSYSDISLSETITNYTSCFEGCKWFSNMNSITGIFASTRDKNFTACFKDSNVTSLADITIRGNISQAFQNSKLTSISNVEFNITNGTDAFRNCTNLATVDNITIGNRVRSLESFLQGCRFEQTSFAIPDSVTNITSLFRDNPNLVDISGMVFGRGVTTYNDWHTNCPLLSTAKNMTIRTTSPILKGDPTIEYIEGLILTENITDISSWFVGCSKLKEDFVFPSHITNCTNTFKDCTGLLYIHSNWNIDYDNDITPTDCYAGCINITHRDGIDLGVNQYIKGLDDVPPEWGGYGLHSDYSTICIMNIPSDNFEMVLNSGGTAAMFDDGLIEWGDGAVTYGTNKHVYAKAGDYVIRGKYWFSNVNLSWAKNIRQLIKGPYGIVVSGFFAFSASSLLTYANISNMTLSSSPSMFNMHGASDAGGPHLTEIVIKNTRVLEGSAMNNFFSTNKALTQIDVSGFILEGGHDWTNMFYGCKNLTTIKGMDKIDWTKITKISNMFRDTAITAVPSGMETADLSNATDISSAFNYCGQLETADLSGWKISSKATSVYAMFHMCQKLKSAKIGNILKSHITNTSQMFVNNYLLETVDITGCDTSMVTTADSMFSGCKSLREVKGIDELNLTKCTNVAAMFAQCSPMTEFNVDKWHLDSVTNCSNMFTNCSKVTSLDFSSYNFNKSTPINFVNMCHGMSSLITIKLPSYLKGSSFNQMFFNCTSIVDLSGVTFDCTTYTPNGSQGTGGMSQMFNGCTALTKIGRLINRGGIRATFSACHKLASIEEIVWANNISWYDNHVIFQGIDGSTELSVKFSIADGAYGPGQFVGASTNNSLNKPNFTRESAVSLLNSLGTFDGPTNSIGSSGHPLTFRSSVRAKLTSADIAIATAKGWTVA